MLECMVCAACCAMCMAENEANNQQRAYYQGQRDAQRAQLYVAPQPQYMVAQQVPVQQQQVYVQPGMAPQQVVYAQPGQQAFPVAQAAYRVG